MADFSFSFLECRCISHKYNRLYSLLPLNHLSTSFNHSYNSRIIKIKRKQLHFALLSKPSSPNFDVISTHEHSDGSLLFRFGDPSEIVENVKPEKPETGKEETEMDGKGEYSVVKVLDGDNEREVMIKKADRVVNNSASIEVADEPNSKILSSNSISFVNEENEYSENALRSFDEIEQPGSVSISSEETEISPIPYFDVQNSVHEQKVLDMEHEDASVENVSLVDEISEIGNSIATEEFLEKEIGDASTLQQDSLEPDNNVVQSRPEIVTTTDGSIESEHMYTEEKNDITESSNESDSTDMIELTPVAVKPEAESKVDKEKHNNNREEKNVITKSGNESDLSDMMELTPVAVQLEAESNVGKEEDDDASEETNEITISGNESYLSDLVTPVAVQLEVESKVDKEEHKDSSEETDEIAKGGIESNLSDMIELKSASLQLEGESKVDKEIDDDASEETDEITKSGLERDLNDLVELTVPVHLEAESKVDKEKDVDTSEATNEITESGNESIVSDVVELTPVPIQLEAESKVDKDKDDHTSEGTNEITESANESILSDMLEFTPVPVQSQAESKADEEKDDDTSEETNGITKSGIESDVSDMIKLTPVPVQLEAESKADKEKDDDTSEERNEITESGNENILSDMVELTPVPVQLQAESKVDKEKDDDTSEETDEIAKSGIESDVSDMIELTPVPVQLEAESKVDKEDDDTVEEFKGNQLVVKNESESDLSEEFHEDDEVERQKLLDNMPQNLMLQTEGIKDVGNVQISELLEASGSKVTELESTGAATDSEEIIKTEFQLSFGAALLPHPSKVLAGGEDAYFVTGETWLGVADGVSQWSLEGTNPGVYAQELIRNCETAVSDINDSSISCPLDLLKISVAGTLSHGSSTVLIARFDGQALHVANVGDSGFLVIRHGTVYKRSSPMLHVFHFPLQIESGDNPSHLAELYQVDLEEEDVIIIATDGLLDNIYDQEISAIILKSFAAGKNLEEIAEVLATKAQEVGQSAFSRSPFADNAQAAGYVGFTGGKLDDVTVIVSVVKRRSNS